MVTIANIPSQFDEPGSYSDVELLAVTVYLEASGEPWLGKLAVAYNPCNRAEKNNWTIHRAILGADEIAYNDGKPCEIYSCWNDNERELTKKRIENIQYNLFVWSACWNSAEAAYNKSEPDPSNGAYFYLNEEVTRQLQGGNLPGWWYSDTDPASEVKIGRHTFRRRKW
jgi:spore germination cell wall hydrolase CwlJ-like protein